MSPRVTRCLWAGLAVPVALLADVVLSASSAAAHNVSAGSLPAPSWLLGYIGAFAVVATAIALRSSWPKARLRIGIELDADAPRPTPGPPASRMSWLAPVGHGLGLLLLGLVLTAAIIGPNANAANIAPVTVFVIWWVGLPILCLVAGDVMRAINPYVPLVAAVERVSGRGAPASDGATDGGRWAAAPDWTAAAFLWLFSWFFLAYHTPGSPRALAWLLVAYSAAAVGGGLRWGRSWLGWGEGFAGISRSVAHVVRPRDEPPPPGLLALVVVWVGATAFDAVSATTFWIKVEGTTVGWSRTFVNTIGLVWLTGVAAAVVLIALRVLDDRSGARDPADGDAEPVAAPWPGTSPARLFGLALVPIGAAWFIAHDLTFLLFEGQNFFALLSDPLGRGWDLFGTINHTINYRIVTAGWVRWVQLGALLLGHTVAVVLAHDGALRLLGRRRGMRVTWAATAVSATSVVGAALLVLK